MFLIATIYISKIASCLGTFLLTYRLYRSRYRPASSTARPIWIALITLLTCSCIGDASWLIILTYKHFSSSFFFCCARLLASRISWIASALTYLILPIFLEKLTTNRFHYSLRHYINAAYAGIVIAALILMLCINFFRPPDTLATLIELYLYSAVDIYVFFTSIPALILAWNEASHGKIPLILKTQIKFLIRYFFIPHLICLALYTNPYSIITTGVIGGYQYLFIAAGDYLYLVTLYFCIKRIITLRFLNVAKLTKTVQSHNFFDDLKIVLGQLGSIMSLSELEATTKAFFAKSFSLKPDQIGLHVRRRTNLMHEPSRPMSLKGIPEVERLLNDSEYADALKHMQLYNILVKDEIAFDYFYEQKEDQRLLLDFLTRIDSDVLIPIYEHKTVIGYITIERNARFNTLFNNAERDEMCLYASYLGAIIYLLQHRNLQELLVQEKGHQEEQYFRAQELSHAKETIKLLIKKPLEQSIGLIHYNRNKIIWANQSAQQMLELDSKDINASPNSFVIKQLAQDVINYKKERSSCIYNSFDKPIECLALPYHGDKHVIVLTHYSKTAEKLAIPYDHLKDLSSWEFALYLETTKSGKLINQLIPMSGKLFLNFKIDLLKIALSKKTPLLELPEEDLPPLCEIIHHISCRSKLYTLSLIKPERADEIAIQLFGIEPSFGTDVKPGLLETLDTIGTLCIRNIELLGPLSQKKLAQYLSTGIFTPIKSENALRTSVRVICSTTANLSALVEQNKFSTDLSRELHGMTLSFPSLLTMPQDELITLAQEIEKHALSNHELDELIKLNERETNQLLSKAPSSINELKRSVTESLVAKSQRKQIPSIANELDTSQLSLEPEIRHALKIGKAALRNKKLLTALWDKFQSQAKIAALLNVNRSSVSRRCKQFNLPIDETE